MGGMGGLTDVVSFGMFYPGTDVADKQLVDFHDRCWKTVKPATDGSMWVRPKMDAIMSSAILAAPGSETGELLIGYPFTSVSTSSTEIVKIQLRVYLGAVMKRPENVILLRNIFFEGLREGSGNKMFDPSKHNVGDGDGMSTDGHDLTVVWFPKKYMLGHSKIDYADFTLENIVKVSDTGERAAYFHTHMQLRRLGMVTETGLDKELIEAGVPTVVYQGACQHKGT